MKLTEKNVAEFIRDRVMGSNKLKFQDSVGSDVEADYFTRALTGPNGGAYFAIDMKLEDGTISTFLVTIQNTDDA